MKERPVHASLTHDANGPIVPRAIRDNWEKPGGLTFLSANGSERFYSYAAVAQEVNRRAMQLRKAGLKRGDRVGFILPESSDFVFSFLGALAAGVVPVPMYPPLSLGRLDGYIESAARILTCARAKALLTDARAQTVLWSLVSRVPTLEQLLRVDDLPDVPEGAKPDLNAIKLDDTAFVQFTSGSTADPKGVVVTHRSLLANLHVIMKFGLEISPDDVAVSWLPLYHDMGLIGFTLAPIWYAVPTIYLPTLDFVKHPTIWMETIHRFRGTLSFAPNFAYALATRRTSEAKLAKLDLSRVKALGCGAEPNHPGTLRAFSEHFAKAGLRPEALLPCYGMAEATLAMTFKPLRQGFATDLIDSRIFHSEGRAVPANGGPVKEFVSCGVPLPGHEIVIVNDDDQPLPERTAGNVVFRGPSVTSGYFDQREITEDVYRTDGLHTGDVGYLADGELYVTGRKKDIVILNGRNYDPQSIEWAAAEVPGIRKGNVVAFSRPGATTEELILVAEAKADQPADLVDRVKRHISEALFLSVAEVILLGAGELPKTSSGKLQRRLTREQYLNDTLGAKGVRTLGSRGQKLMVAKHFSLSLMAKIRHNVRRSAARIMAVPPMRQTKSDRSQHEQQW